MNTIVNGNLRYNLFSYLNRMNSGFSAPDSPYLYSLGTPPPEL